MAGYRPSFIPINLLKGTVRPLSVSFFIEKEPHKQLRMKRKRKGEREEKETLYQVHRIEAMLT
jgi:hypothetical protein